MPSIRDAFGAALVKIGEIHKELIVIDADNSLATRTEEFHKIYPSRFINVGCAEQNMIGISAGISLTGIPVVCSTFSIFLCGRAFEQIRHAICQNNLSVTLLGTHAGITVGKDGSSHFAIEDIALMRSIPNMEILVASNANQAYQMLETAINSKNPTYIRGSRFSTEAETSPVINIGGLNKIQEGNEISIFFCGIVMDNILKAISKLEEKGISIELIEVYSIKPINEKLILSSIKKTKRALVIEEHNKHGGLGDAIMNISSCNYPIIFEHICINDTFAESGTPEDLLDHYNFSVLNIVDTSMRLLCKKV